MFLEEELGLLGKAVEGVFENAKRSGFNHDLSHGHQATAEHPPGSGSDGEDNPAAALARHMIEQ